MTDHEFVAC